MISWNDRRKDRPGMSADKQSYKVSDNVTVKAADGNALTMKSVRGASQARKQNAAADATPSKAESKANARGLKAANSNTVFKVNKPMTRLFGGANHVGHDVQVERGSKKEARLEKRKEWATSYSDKQMKKFDAKMKKAK
jgi:hypothetical protein